MLRKIYDDEAKMQRPIALEDRDKTIEITQNNWQQYLGNAKSEIYMTSSNDYIINTISIYSAYNGFFNFFSAEVQNSGIVDTLDRYIFSPSANEKGSRMLVRLMSGA